MITELSSYKSWRSLLNFAWNICPWHFLIMTLQLITQVSRMRLLRFRTRAWYARLARALVRSSVMYTFGSSCSVSPLTVSVWSSPWASPFSRPGLNSPGFRLRRFLRSATTRSLLRLLTYLTRSGRGPGGGASVSSGTCSGCCGPTRWDTTISSSCNWGTTSSAG